MIKNLYNEFKETIVFYQKKDVFEQILKTR